MTDFEQRYVTARKAVIARDLARLNPMQRQGAMTTEGPLLLLAGAGSGKTTVLVNRIANLIRFGSAHGSKQTPRPATEDDIKALRNAIMTGTAAPSWLDGMLRRNAVRSWNVMAITFTNKAAGELKERLRRMLGGEEGDEVFASTFHSACVRIRRRWADRAALQAVVAEAQSKAKAAYTADSYANLETELAESVELLSRETLYKAAALEQVTHLTDAVQNLKAA